MELWEGCDYQVWATTPGGNTAVLDLTEWATDVSYGRLDSSTSKAQVTFSKRAGQHLNLHGEATRGDCCASFSRMATLSWDLLIRRGGTDVWQGPLGIITEKVDTVAVQAWDQSVWFRDWRTLDTAYTDAGDLNDLGHGVISRALGSHPMGVLVASGAPTGQQSTVTVPVGKRPAASDLDTFARAGWRWSMLGRVMDFDAGDADPLALDDSHFLDDLTIVQDGAGWGSRIFVNGTGAIQGRAGGVNPDGVVKDVIVSETTITDQASADNAASRRYYAGGGDRPQAQVIVPPNASLAPDVPYGLNDLRCGRRVTVYLQGWCTAPAQHSTLVLDSVAVKATGAQGGTQESVQVTLKPLAATTSDTVPV